MQNLNQLFSQSSTSQTADVIHLHHDRVTLYKRSGSNHWQCRFKLPTGSWHVASTGVLDVDAAKQEAVSVYERVMAKLDRELSLKTKTFGQLAKEEIANMANLKNEGKGKAIFKDYVFVLNKYLIPFFDKTNILQITPEMIREFESWRMAVMGRDPMASTKRTHATTYNRVIHLAREQRLIPKELSVPAPDAHGTPAQARPAFSAQEIDRMLEYIQSWEFTGFSDRSRDVRRLTRPYVEFLLYTGVRPGTEIMPMRWKHLQWHWIGEKRYLKVWVSGKTGPRYLIAKHTLVDSLERLISWLQLPYANLEELIDARLDHKIFVMPDGTQPYNLHGSFEHLLKSCGLLKDVANRTRSLYSLRHTYATFALAEGIDIHTLARQMGTSTLMIERHYSKLTPMMAAEKLA